MDFPTGAVGEKKAHCHSVDTILRLKLVVDTCDGSLLSGNLEG